MKYLLIVLGIVIGIMGAVIFFLTVGNSQETKEVVVEENATDEHVEEKEKKQGWQEIGVFAGTNNENTKPFVVNEDVTKWRITYTLNGADYLPTFSINILDNSTREIVKLGMSSNGLSDLVASSGTKEVLIEDLKEGEYYLEVISGNIDNWEIVVEELY